LIALAIVVAVEAIGMIVLTALLVASIVGARAGTYDVTSSVALAVCTLVAAAGLALVTWGILHARKWTRPAALVWQLVQILVGLDAFQGAGARPDLGTLLLIPGVVALVLLFTPGVSRVLGRR
jgi:ABC-type Mn2+/Zn2+ transport system permease subunit